MGVDYSDKCISLIIAIRTETYQHVDIVKKENEVFAKNYFKFVPNDFL